jgi:hypothetical protein
MKESGIGSAEKSIKTLLVSEGLKKVVSIWAEKPNISSPEKNHVSTGRANIIGAEK